MLRSLKFTLGFTLALLLASVWLADTASAQAQAQTPSPSPAKGSNFGDLLSPPPGDLSAILLRQIFPISATKTEANGAPSITDSGQQTVFNEIIATMNKGFALLGGIMLMWTLAVGVVSSAHEGNFLGKNHSSLWGPVRIAVGAAAFVPLVSGYTAAQLLIGQTAYASLGLASNLWSYAVVSVTSGKPMINFTDTNGPNLVKSVLESRVCQILVNDNLSSENYSTGNGKQRGISISVTKQSGALAQAENFVASFDYVDGMPAFPKIKSGEKSTSAPPLPVTTNGQQILNSGICGRVEITNSGYVPQPGYGSGAFNVSDTSPTYDPEKAMGQKMFSVQVKAATDLINSTQINDLAWRIYATHRDKGERDPLVLRQMQQVFASENQKYQNEIVSQATKTWQETYSRTTGGNGFNNANAMQAYNGAVASTGFTSAAAYFMGLTRINAQILNIVHGNIVADAPMSDSESVVGAYVDNALTNLIGIFGSGISEDLRRTMVMAREYTNVIAGTPGGLTMDLAADAGVRYGEKGSLAIGRDALNSGLANTALQLLTPSGGTGGRLNPFQSMIDMGHNLITAGVGVYAVSMGGKGVSWVLDKVGRLPLVGGVAAKIGQKGVDGISAIGTWLGSSMILSGVLLAYVLPILPVIFWIFGVIGWLVMVFEGIVAAPLWGLAHIRMDGEGLAGPSGRTGYELYFNIAVRPALMVIGFFVAIIIFQFGNSLVIAMFVPAMKFTAAGHTALIGAAIWPLMAAFTSVSIAWVCFRFTTSIADNVPRWIGMAPAQGSVDPVNEGRMAMGAMGYGAMKSGMSNFENMMRNIDRNSAKDDRLSGGRKEGDAKQDGMSASIRSALEQSPSDMPRNVEPGGNDRTV